MTFFSSPDTFVYREAAAVTSSSGGGSAKRKADEDIMKGKVHASFLVYILLYIIIWWAKENYRKLGK